MNNDINDTKIAIVGMGCRFPGGASNPEQYWELLKNGIDATCEVPKERWDLKRFYDPDRSAIGKTYVSRGGFLNGAIDEFDPAFFGISPREATPMDPQQKLLLEVVWEAFEDAGIVAKEVAGSQTGVYMGAFTLDNKIHLLNAYNRELISTHTAISSTAGMLANRLSYTFDFRGPSMTIDTACSSSAVAIHLACKDLIHKDCNLALAGGVNVMIRPEYTIAMSKGGFLAPDGRCKTFDMRADGYGRGEGAGVLVLKRLEDAIRDGDPIHAVIAGSGVNQDGNSDSITAPNSDSQINLLNKVYKNAGVSPDQVQYIEAHGTGTKVGDKAETRSLGKAIACKRKGKSPLMIGSVKANIGHLEAAAAVAGVIKTIMCLKKKAIPKNLHLDNPNPEIPFDDLRLKVPLELSPFPEHEGDTYAGVNSFGYGGTNAHIILQSAPSVDTKAVLTQERPRMFPISANSQKSHFKRIKQVIQVLKSNPELNLEDLGFTLSQKLSHLKYRNVTIASNQQELLEKLEQLNIDTTQSTEHLTGPRKTNSDAKCAFIFTGMGAQSWGMAIDLLEQDDNAKVFFNSCDEIWIQIAGWSLKRLFTKSSGEPMLEPQDAQPANLIVQLMLLEVLRSYGIKPEGNLGHSVGEIAAAYSSGSLSLKDVLTLVYHRSQLQQNTHGKGKMLAVSLSSEEIIAWTQPYEGLISIAAINSPSSVTLAGAPEALLELSEKFSEEEIFNRVLKVEVAYHSYQMEHLEDKFKDCLKTLKSHKPHTQLYSSVYGGLVSEEQQDVEYWWKNLRNTVHFSDALEAMILDGYNTFVEIGPHSVLSAAIKENLQKANRTGECFSTLNRKASVLEGLYDSMAGLFVHGVQIDWTKQFKTGNLISLGAYPWVRDKIWQETLLSQNDRLGVSGHPLLQSRADEPQPTWEGELSPYVQKYLADHRIDGEIIFPGAGYLEMALTAQHHIGNEIVLENVKFHQALSVKESPIVRLISDIDGNSFNIYSRSQSTDSGWNKNVSGEKSNVFHPIKAPHLDQSKILARTPEKLNIQAFYELLSGLGLEFGPHFKTIQQAYIGDKELFSELEVNTNFGESTVDYFVHPTLLDGAFQSLLALATEEIEKEGKIFIPFDIKKIHYYRKPGKKAKCYAKITEKNNYIVKGNLALYNEENQLCLEITGFRAKGIVVKSESKVQKLPAQYISEWYNQAANPQQISEDQTWLVFADSHKIGQQLMDIAFKKHVNLIQVSPGNVFSKKEDHQFQIRRNSREDMEQLLQHIEGSKPNAIVYLWGLDQENDQNLAHGHQATGTSDIVDLTHLVQSLESLTSNHIERIIIGIHNAQRITREDSLSLPGQNAINGIARVINLEYPKYKVKMVDLQSLFSSTAADQLMTELQDTANETEVAYRHGARLVNRIAPYSPGTKKVSSESNTSFTYLQDKDIFKEVSRILPEKEEVEFTVQTIYPINLSAVLIEEEEHEFLSYCTGYVCRSGSPLFEEGQPIICVVPKSGIQSYMTLSADSLFPVPQGILIHEAVTIPIWIMAWKILFEKGNLLAGETVLIHDASTDVRLAILLLAKWKGATVFVTEGNDESKTFLESLDLDHVFSSKSFDFIAEIKKYTTEKGVDLLISNTGILLNKSIELVCTGGRFICLNESDSPTGQIPISTFDREIHFSVANLRNLSEIDIKQNQGIIDQLQSVVADNHLMDHFMLNRFSVKTLNELHKRYKGGGLFGASVINVHGEKVKLSHRLISNFIKPDAGYIITGGLSGFGLSTLHWLVQKGARHIIVMSRSGSVSPDAQKVLTEAESLGCQILNEKVDISDHKALTLKFQSLNAKFPEIKGIIHSAAVIEDASLENLNSEQIHKVMEAKAVGAWNLHCSLSEHKLDFFICYSSISSMLGNVSQANYAAANAYVDGLVQYRRSHGLPGLSINWGVIGDVGIVARDQKLRKHLSQFGLNPINSKDGLDCMLTALNEDQQQVGVFDIEWKQWSSHFEFSNNRLEKVISTVSKKPQNDEVVNFRKKISNEDSELRIFSIQNHLVNILSSILKTSPNNMDKNSNLMELGIDSLMSMEVRFAIRQQMGVQFRALFLLRGPKISELANLILEEIIQERITDLSPIKAFQ
ncbi:MAG: acyl transferase domain-containing protein/NADPH:quinone reductase-like Zn-dependent oxidoreductase [Psychroserpens sp.]|jgi:acyl transferase domain-containing protein/NADPH:quinone reductase-like Zn-dependent oxidoreductase/acyl carrier protein